MNFLVLTVVSSLFSGVAFYALGGSVLITSNSSMLLSFEAIIIAAVLVRLNRGIPSLEWKYVDATALERLLTRLQEVARVYVAVVLVATASILVLIAALFVDKLTLSARPVIMLWLATSFGVLLGLLLSRMAYVVWLDLDIIKLQKTIILSAAEAEHTRQQTRVAEEKIAAIGGTRLPR